MTKQTKAKQPKRPIKFTDAFLARLKPTGDARAVTLFEAGGPGLGVRASRSGKIAFIAQLAIPNDKRRWRETIGTWGGMTIDDARMRQPTEVRHATRRRPAQAARRGRSRQS